ncbi:hypothetical protein [Armatimonas rosea]|uniref:Uncharacterized protein n=1 Tax=Armatimonas rosea TaxID=685828 RepID=A0A7W9SVL5_ARMRO|nr:hypothetical protein [Armatimonas rosea]MBB6053170.1 hypothetical protein [Armatimonas rosea]
MPDSFPIAVWLQSPENAHRYRAAGINLYVGLWQGPTEAQLAALNAAKMPVICEQNAVGLAHKEDPIIAAWMHGDEPDNAQLVRDPVTGKKSWGPCVPPQKIVADYKRLRAADPTRPILLNLGQGVANDAWKGRGAGAKLSDYETYVQGGDIISFDVYPAANNLPLGLVPKGVDRLVEWTEGKKPIWNCVECTRIDGKGKATPRQVRNETWRAIIHGSRGIIYFVHQFQPKFNEHALLDDPEMLAMVTATNKQIRELAGVINNPRGKRRVQNGVELLTVEHQGATYILAAATGERTVTIELDPCGKLEVLGEGRTVSVRDTFAPDDVHLYRMTGQ